MFRAFAYIFSTLLASAFTLFSGDFWPFDERLDCGIIGVCRLWLQWLERAGDPPTSDSPHFE
jgi:hypothetical protein